MTWAHARRAGDDLRTIPQVLDRIADQFDAHDALVADDRRLTGRRMVSPAPAS